MELRWTPDWRVIDSALESNVKVRGGQSFEWKQNRRARHIELIRSILYTSYPPRIFLETHPSLIISPLAIIASTITPNSFLCTVWSRLLLSLERGYIEALLLSIVDRVEVAIFISRSSKIIGLIISTFLRSQPSDAEISSI